MKNLQFVRRTIWVRKDQDKYLDKRRKKNGAFSASALVRALMDKHLATEEKS